MLRPRPRRLPLLATIFLALRVRLRPACSAPLDLDVDFDLSMRMLLVLLFLIQSSKHRSLLLPRDTDKRLPSRVYIGKLEFSHLLLFLRMVLVWTPTPMAFPRIPKKDDWLSPIPHPMPPGDAEAKQLFSNAKRKNQTRIFVFSLLLCIVNAILMGGVLGTSYEVFQLREFLSA